MGPCVDPMYAMNIYIETLRPRQNGRHFEDDIVKCPFLDEKVWFDYNFNEVCSLGFKLTICHYWFKKSIIWTNNASFGRSDFKNWTEIEFRPGLVCYSTELILGLHPANDRRCYI